MPLYEIVICEVQGNRRLEVFEFLAESIGEPGQAAHVEASRAVQSLNVTGGRQAQVGKASHRLLFGYDDLRCAESALRDVRIIGYVGLYDLGEVYVRSKIHLDCIHIGSQSIAGDLHAVPHTRRYIRNKGVSGWQIALTTFEGWNDFSLGVYRAERPNVAKLKAIIGLAMALFLADESPNLIELEMLASQIAHFGV